MILSTVRADQMRSRRSPSSASKGDTRARGAHGGQEAEGACRLAILAPEEIRKTMEFDFDPFFSSFVKEPLSLLYLNRKQNCVAVQLASLMHLVFAVWLHEPNPKRTMYMTEENAIEIISETPKLK